MKITKIDKSNKPDIKDYQTCRVKTCGNVVEIMARTTKGKPKQYLKKISNDYYTDTRTGEVYEYNHINNRADNLQTVSRSLANLRDLLNTNIKDISKCRWITLTYAENMTDPEKLKKDFRYFNKKCRDRYGHYEYITAAEPQGRGAWHLHCVFIFNDKAPFMANDEVRELWGKGFVTVKKLDNVDNVGAYLTAYLGDMELTDENAGQYTNKQIKEVQYEENGIKKTKRYIKGARLSMYPPKFNIYRFSRGIAKPIIEEMSYYNAKEKVRDAAQTYSKAVKLDDEKGFTDTIVYEYYNVIRAKSQEETEKTHEKSKADDTYSVIEEKNNAEDIENEVNYAEVVKWIKEQKQKSAAAAESHARAVLSAADTQYKEVSLDDDIWQQF